MKILLHYFILTMEYYNYIIGTGGMPNFDIDDPNETKFNNVISKLVENDKDCLLYTSDAADE